MKRRVKISQLDFLGVVRIFLRGVSICVGLRRSQTAATEIKKQFRPGGRNCFFFGAHAVDARLAGSTPRIGSINPLAATQYTAYRLITLSVYSQLCCQRGGYYIVDAR